MSSEVAMKHSMGILLLSIIPSIAYPGVCDISWDGDKLAANSRGRPLTSGMRLLDKNKNVNAELTAAQILAFHEAKEAISSQLGRSPIFLVCDNKAPNAFATKGNNGDIVGVTVGMMKLANGDRDMAASVIGHEFAHHLKDHMSTGQARDMALGLIGLIAGIAIDNKLQAKTGVQGLGLDLGRLGSALVSRKFDRDQEREADELGFTYMVNSGFNPNGAVRLADRMRQIGLGGAGIFFDSHPGWDERAERFRGLIATNPVAQQIIARTGTSTSLTTEAGNAATTQVALAPTYETTDAQKSFADGVAAWRRNDIVAAVRDIRSAATAGYAPAQNAVGALYLSGRGGLEKNEAEAARHFALAAEQFDQSGQINLGMMYLRGAGGLPKDELEALRLFQLAAEQGSPAGMKNIGDLHINGRAGFAKDQVEALKWYRRAADLGHGDSLNAVGIYHQLGWGGVAKDEAEAARLYRLASEKGSAAGRLSLARLYWNGTPGVEKNPAEAVKLLRMAASQGNANAQNDLANILSQGLGGIQKNDIEAAQLYKSAADQGNPYAQANLAGFYASGRGGIFRDDVEAVRLYKLAAEQGNPGGQAGLAFMYENGRGGLAKDVELAVSMYQKAASQGNTFSKNRLSALGR
jgi:TPR repeat protein